MTDGQTTFAVTQRSVLRLYPVERLIQQIYPEQGIVFLSGFTDRITTDKLFETKKAGLKYVRKELIAEMARFQDRLDEINKEIELEK